MLIMRRRPDTFHDKQQCLGSYAVQWTEEEAAEFILIWVCIDRGSTEFQQPCPGCVGMLLVIESSPLEPWSFPEEPDTVLSCPRQKRHHMRKDYGKGIDPWIEGEGGGREVSRRECGGIFLCSSSPSPPRRPRKKRAHFINLIDSSLLRLCRGPEGPHNIHLPPSPR